MKEREADKWYELGRVAAFEAIAPELNLKAGNYYVADQFDNASLCKELSAEYRKRAESMRADYEKKYPK